MAPVKQASERMFKTVDHYVDQVVVVDEPSIEKGITYVGTHHLLTVPHGPFLRGKRWHTNELPTAEVPYRALPGEAKSVHEARQINWAEGAAAAPLAAVLFGDKYGDLDWKKIADGRKELNVYCILTGGNVPKDKFVEIAKRRVNEIESAFH